MKHILLNWLGVLKVYYYKYKRKSLTFSIYEKAKDTRDRIDVNYFSSAHSNTLSLMTLYTTYHNIKEYTARLDLFTQLLTNDLPVTQLQVSPLPTHIYISDFFTDNNLLLIDPVPAVGLFINAASSFLTTYERTSNLSNPTPTSQRNVTLLANIVSNVIIVNERLCNISN